MGIIGLFVSVDDHVGDVPELLFVFWLPYADYAGHGGVPVAPGQLLRPLQPPGPGHQPPCSVHITWVPEPPEENLSLPMSAVTYIYIACSVFGFWLWS